MEQFCSIFAVWVQIWPPYTLCKWKQIKRKYVHKLLVNRLFKPAQEKVLLGELTVPQWP